MYLLCIDMSSAQENQLQISPKIGFRLHSNGLYGLRTAGPRRVISAPMLGINFSITNKPYSVSIEKDWNLSFSPYTLARSDGNIGQYWTETSVLLRYKLKRFDVSAGYFYMERENSNNHELGSFLVRNYQGVLLGIYREFDWLGVELRTKVLLDPDFDAIVGLENYNLVLSYTLKKNKVKTNTKSIFDDKLQLRANVGSRFFPVEGIEILTNETFPRIGISPSIGIELQHMKSGVSFNVEKDFWFSVNGGSSRREIKGYFVSTFIGFRCHLELKNTHHLRTGVGYSLIRDLDKMARPYKAGFHNYQVKGMGASISYEVIKNTDIELKHTFSIASKDDESLLRPMRFSAGIIYRIRPGFENE